MIVLSSPDAEGSRVTELGNDELAALDRAIPRVRVLIAHDQAITAARRSAYFSEGC